MCSFKSDPIKKPWNEFLKIYMDMIYNVIIQFKFIYRRLCSRKGHKSCHYSEWQCSTPCSPSVWTYGMGSLWIIRLAFRTCHRVDFICLANTTVINQTAKQLGCRGRGLRVFPQTSENMLLVGYIQIQWRYKEQKGLIFANPLASFLLIITIKRLVSWSTFYIPSSDHQFTIWAIR